MRYAKRRDLNHTDIASALRKAGFEVIDFGSAGYDIPDLLAVKPLQDGLAYTCWVEVKSKSGRLKTGQKRFQSIFQPKGEWYEGRDPEETVVALQTLYLARMR